MMSVQRGFDLNDFLCFVPVINMSLFFREVMEGIYDLRHILFVFLSTSIYASVALRASVKLFHDENALFSLEKPFALFIRRRYLKAKPVPSLGEALFACAVIFALYYYFSSFLAQPSGEPSDVLWGTMLSQWAALLLPIILFARYLKLDVRQTFSLRRFRAVHGLGTLLLYAGAFFLLLELAYLQKDLVPVQEEVVEEMSSSIQMGSFLLVALSLAVTPAICEEMMFRGFVLAGMSRLAPAARILLNGVLFSLYHVFLFKLLPTAFLGMVISFIVVYSGSIFLGMILHFLNNFVALSLTHYNRECTAFFEEIGLGPRGARWLEGEAHVPWPVLFASAATLILGALLIWRFRFRGMQSPGDNTAKEPEADARMAAEKPTREVPTTEEIG